MGNLCSCCKEENENFKIAVKILKREKYKYKRKLGSGSFGDVVEVRTMDKKRLKLAAKIVSAEHCSHIELELWSSFQHDNILPLLKIIHESDIDIFLMPLHKLTMMEAVEEDSFFKSVESFNVTKNWLSDVLSGLIYLHSRNICHADLKVDNILITDKRTAVICDFSFSCLMTGNITQYGLTWFFRPPEAFPRDGLLDPVNGETFDLWSFGVLALYTWTRIYSAEKISSREHWLKLTYPILFVCLQLPVFNILVIGFFPKAVITTEEIFQALNLLQGVLHYEAEKRPPASVILQHPFLNKEASLDNLFEVCSIWTYRHSQLPNELQNASSDMDEWGAGAKIETYNQDFTNTDTFTRASSENRTNEPDENIFDLSLSSETSSRTMRPGGTESYLDNALNVEIMENRKCNRENADVKIPFLMEDVEDHSKESPNSKDMHVYQRSNAGATNKNLSSKNNVTSTSDFFHSHVHYLGCSLLHELMMML